MISKYTIVVLCFLLSTACQRPLGSEMWRASDPGYVPFAVKDIVVSADNRFVGLTVDERAQNEKQTLAGDLTVYVLDLRTGDHRRLGSNGILLPIGTDQFLYFESERSSKPPALIQGLETIRTFNIGEHNGAWWNSKTSTAIFPTGWPKDMEGFDRITLLKPSTGATEAVRLHTVSELLATCPATGKFYTGYTASDDIDEYDDSGHFRSTIHSPLAVYSANCRYVLPFAAVGVHGPENWGVFEASSRIQLISFAWNEDGKSELHWFKAWNPHHDNLLLMNSAQQLSKTDTIEILDIAKQKVVKSWPNPEGGSPIQWTGDGESTVTVRDHHVAFEPLGGAVLDSSIK